MSVQVYVPFAFVLLIVSGCVKSSLCFQVYLQLLAELRRLGCGIVYASFSKLVVSTGKDSVEKGEQ